MWGQICHGIKEGERIYDEEQQDQGNSDKHCGPWASLLWSAVQPFIKLHCCNFQISIPFAPPSTYRPGGLQFYMDKIKSYGVRVIWMFMIPPLMAYTLCEARRYDWFKSPEWPRYCHYFEIFAVFPMDESNGLLKVSYFFYLFRVFDQ